MSDDKSTQSTKTAGQGPVFTISANRVDNAVSPSAPVQATDVSTGQREVEEMFAAAIALNPQVFGSSLTITRDQFDVYLHAKIGDSITLPMVLDIGKVDDELASHEASGPNGVEYEHNDILYLMNNGYTKEEALTALAADKKYTTPVTEVATNSTQTAANAKRLEISDAVAKAQNDTLPTATAAAERANALSAKVTAGTITPSEYTEYLELTDTTPNIQSVMETTAKTSVTPSVTTTTSTSSTRLTELSAMVDAGTATDAERVEYVKLSRAAMREKISTKLKAGE